MKQMMPFVAIDVETTGLNWDRHQVLEIGAVIEPGEWLAPVDRLSTFRALVDPGEICGQPKALVMNKRLLDEIDSSAGRYTLDGAVSGLFEFIKERLDFSVTIAGKNFGAFDLNFLRRSERWPKIRHKHRFIDVGNLFWNPFTDTCLPDLATCRERAGLPFVEAHDAVQDCRSVIECVRAAFPMPTKVAS